MLLGSLIFHSLQKYKFILLFKASFFSEIIFCANLIKSEVIPEFLKRFLKLQEFLSIFGTLKTTIKSLHTIKISTSI